MPALRPADRAFFAHPAVVRYVMYTQLEQCFNFKVDSRGLLLESFHKQYIPYVTALRKEADGEPQFNEAGEPLRNRFPEGARCTPEKWASFWMRRSLAKSLRKMLYQQYKTAMETYCDDELFVEWRMCELSRELFPDGMAATTTFKGLTLKDFPASLAHEMASLMRHVYRDENKAKARHRFELAMELAYDADDEAGYGSDSDEVGYDEDDYGNEFDVETVRPDDLKAEQQGAVEDLDSAESPQPIASL